jgi:probable HAF family extracellular repeat protein
MRRTRLLAASLLAALHLPACRSDTNPVGPTEVRAAFSTHGAATSVRVTVDTLARASNAQLGLGVSDAGGIPVTALSDPVNGTTEGGVWTEGGITFLPGAGGATAITASGEVLGHTASGITIWGAAGPRLVGQGQALALNDLATVVTGFAAGEPARWDAGAVSPLQHPGQDIGGVVPLAANNSGTVVGVGIITSLDSRAVRWDGTVPSLLPELAPGGAHGALAIDNAGRIVGYSTGTVEGLTGRFPVVWENGAPRPLPTLGDYSPFGNAQGIDDAGNIVGWLRTESGEDHAVLWTAAGELIDLGASLPGLISYPRGVNATGVVSGVAFPLGGNPDTDQPIVVRWTLEPASRYTFDGLFAPLANAPVVNEVKVGKAVPVRFSLGGDYGLDVFEVGYPQARTVPCDTTAAAHRVEETVNAKSSGLIFDLVTQRYTYLWKTERSWVGSCRELVLRLDDGQERLVRLRLMR